MPNKIESNSRQLLGRLRDTMAEEAKGQDRLDKITQLIASYRDRGLFYLFTSRSRNVGIMRYRRVRN